MTTEQTETPLPCLPQVKKHDLDLTIRTAIENLDPAGPLEDVVAMHAWLSDLLSLVKNWKPMMERKFVEALQAHGENVGPDQTLVPATINVGDCRYYVGTQKTTKAKNNMAIMHALMEASGGDEAILSDCFASGAWKYGAVRQIVGDEKFYELFDVTEQPDLLTGKPKVGLREINTKFLR